MKSNLKITVAIAAAFALVIGVLLVVTLTNRGPDADASSQSQGQKGGSAKDGSAEVGPEKAPKKIDPRLVRSDSHRLQQATGANAGKATFVEFLDFECPGCGQAYPAIEQLRKKYAGKVTFVVRYLPMPMHANGETSARAVEAAGRQGKFEQMYQKMYDTQPEWSEQQDPQDAYFRKLAGQIGLDLKKYDKDYKDPAVLDRVKKDMKDAQSLGVTGTPTFFLNGEQLQPRTYEDLVTALDKAIAS